MIGACTVVSPNYVAFARVLSASYLAHHPGQRFFVLIVADTDDRGPFTGASFEPVMLGEIGLPDLRGTAMMYDILELNTNVKPAFMAYLLERYELDQLVYLDPDIAVYDELTPVFAALDAGACAVLTPHITDPVDDGRSPSEQDHLYNGTYNLGFIAVRRSDETARLLAWWSARCLALGFSEGRTGLFVDQKWMNLAPGLFADVAILRDAGCNMAYWNLQERALSPAVVAEDDVAVRAELIGAGAAQRMGGKSGAPARTRSAAAVRDEEPSDTFAAGGEHYVVNGEVALRFFHFSGIDPADDAQLSRNTDRFTLADRPDLHAVFRGYRAALASERGSAAEQVPYGFDRLSDGTVVTRLARRIYSSHRERWAGTDPFAAHGDFGRFARRLGLVAGKEPPAKSTWREFNGKDRRVLAIHRLLRAALRVLGPNRYELLMRYLAYITVLRHQGVFLDEPKP